MGEKTLPLPRFLFQITHQVVTASRISCLLYTSVLKKVKNPDLKNLLENYRFTSANQIVVAMKEQEMCIRDRFTRSAMDEYALNFGRDNIRGGRDLMYYARVETERSYHPEDEEVKQGLSLIHISER